VPLIVHGVATAANLAGCLSLDRSLTVVYMSFLAFELTTGMFYPAYGSIKSSAIPEEVGGGAGQPVISPARKLKWSHPPIPLVPAPSSPLAHPSHT
jgi:hypothetical protein